MPTVSVIVPVYNAESYIHSCVDSILNQTFINFELILVDDGSSDNCGAICDKYRAMDNRVFVIHQKNQGVAAARNAGLDVAKGKYIAFVDSDDLCRTHLLETVTEYMDKGYDLISFSHNKLTNRCEYVCNKFLGEYIINNPSDLFYFLTCIVLRGYIGWEPWRNIYSKKIIDKTNIRFTENKLMVAEDLQFFLCYCLHVSKVFSLSESLYYYRRHDNSITDTINGSLTIDCMNEISRITLNYYLKYADLEIVLKYPVINYMIQRHGLLPHINCNIRELIIIDVKNIKYFDEQLELLKYFKKELNIIFGKNQAIEELILSQYYINGNYLLFKLRCKLNVIISNFKNIFNKDVS